MVKIKCRQTIAAQVAKSSLSSIGNNANDNVDYELKPRNLVRITIHLVCLCFEALFHTANGLRTHSRFKRHNLYVREKVR